MRIGSTSILAGMAALLALGSWAQTARAGTLLAAESSDALVVRSPDAVGARSRVADPPRHAAQIVSGEFREFSSSTRRSPSRERCGGAETGIRKLAGHLPALTPFRGGKET
jgi:hypothetical protein